MCALQHLGVLFEIGIGAHTDLEPLALGPLDEGHLPIRPTRRAGIAGKMVDLDVTDVGGILRMGAPVPVTRRPLPGGLWR